MNFEKYCNTNHITQLAKNIGMPQDALETLLNIFPTLDFEEVCKIYPVIVDSNRAREATDIVDEIAGRETGELICVLIYMIAAGVTHERYRTKGIPDSIFYNTFNCLPEKMETNMYYFGNWGYPCYRWPLGHLSMRIFRLERLGFEMNTHSGAPIVYQGETIIADGDDYIGVHISDREKFTHELCLKSYAEARKLFSTYFPDFKPKYFRTTTWLLCPRLKELLPETSNILKFQSDFTIYDSYDDDKEVLARVFGGVKENLDDYPQDTTLRKKIIERFKAGKHLGRGSGFIKF